MLKANKWYVTLYLTNRAFGGKEEGGWWYNTEVVEDSTNNQSFDEKNIAEWYLENLQKYENKMNEGRFPIDSAASTGIYRFRLEDRKPHNKPAERPIYE